MQIKFIYDNQLKLSVYEAMISKFHKIIKDNVNFIKQRISSKTRILFQSVPIYESLTSGELMAHFGLPKEKAHEIVDKIIITFSEEIDLTYNNQGFNVYVVKDNFEHILALDEAAYYSVNAKKERRLIPWLDWFLIQGDRILVNNYHIQFGKYNRSRSRSRSTLAIMKPGSNWRVDPKYSGVINDNWITRVISEFQAYFETVLKDAIEELF